MNHEIPSDPADDLSAIEAEEAYDPTADAVSYYRANGAAWDDDR